MSVLMYIVAKIIIFHPTEKAICFVRNCSLNLIYFIYECFYQMILYGELLKALICMNDFICIEFMILKLLTDLCTTNLFKLYYFYSKM